MIRREEKAAAYEDVLEIFREALTAHGEDWRARLVDVMKADVGGDYRTRMYEAIERHAAAPNRSPDDAPRD